MAGLRRIILDDKDLDLRQEAITEILLLRHEEEVKSQLFSYGLPDACKRLVTTALPRAVSSA
jgi:hypothetical protein